MKILLLDDGNIGNFVQSYGIAKNFPESEIVILSFKFKGPKYKLPKRKGKYPLLPKIFNIFCFLKLYKIGGFFLKLFFKNWRELKEGKYDIVINSGSLLSSLNLIISKMNNARSVQIMLPSFLPLDDFDFLILPYHDYLRVKRKKLKNIIVTLGAPNLIDEEILKIEGEKLKRIIGEKNKKIIGFLVGGDDQNYRIDKDWIEGILSEFEKLKEDFDFLITTSKRTDEEVIKYIESWVKKTKEVKYLEIPGKSENSYYKGILSLSDIIFVSEDSINMISEAISSNKNIFILGVKRRKNKELIFDFTIKEIEKNGYAFYIPYRDIYKLREKLYKFQKREIKFNEAKKCAQEILARLN